MKRAIVVQRLPHLLLGGLIIGLLVASAVVLPATPAQAADQYFSDFSIAEDLSYQYSDYAGEKKDLSEEYGTEDSNKICEKLKSKQQRLLNQESKSGAGIINQKVDNCRFQGSLFFIDISGKLDEKLLKNPTSMSRLKIINEDELEYTNHIPLSAQSGDLDEIAKRENLGIRRLTFPGKIKSVTPNIGKISGNTWTLDKPLTSTERDKLKRSAGDITFTAERHSSKLGLILGITIPAALIIVAIIVLLIVRSNRKKKQQPFPPYPAGSGAYPPPPFMPGNSPCPTQPQVPGYPAAPGNPGMPGAASYPPNVPPPGQPGAPTRGGYNPYPYPYPPANPQGSPVRYSMPNQAYGTPTPGFPPPAAPPQPAAGQQESPDDSNQANPTEQPGQVN